MVRVVATSLVKAWSNTRAVDDISFTVEEGSFTVLLGPSGCGKSTTLRMLAGLDEPTSGHITIGGRDVAGLTGTARGVSMVFQSYAIFPHMTVADNITFGLSVRHTSKSEIAARLDKVADLLGLQPLLSRKPSQISGGQQQRVALGRALIAEAPICLMDEPLSNLDAKLRQELRREIRALQQRLGITMIYVTHDQSEAMSMADDVILMNGGRIEQQGPASSLYERPESLFAARFIGGASMNLVDLENSTSGAGAVMGGAAGPTIMERPGKGLVLGLRPEDVALATLNTPLEENGITGPEVTVTDIEYLGADALATCRAEAGPVLTARVRGADAPSPGERMRASWKAEAMHVFERDSGRRINTPGEDNRGSQSTTHHEREISR